MDSGSALWWCDWRALSYIGPVAVGSRRPHNDWFLNHTLFEGALPYVSVYHFGRNAYLTPVIPYGGVSVVRSLCYICSAAVG